MRTPQVSKGDFVAVALSNMALLKFSADCPSDVELRKKINGVRQRSDDLDKERIAAVNMYNSANPERPPRPNRPMRHYDHVFSVYSKRRARELKASKESFIKAEKQKVRDSVVSSTAGEVETTSAQMCEDNDGTHADASEVETTSAIMSEENDDTDVKSADALSKNDVDGSDDSEAWYHLHPEFVDDAGKSPLPSELGKDDDSLKKEKSALLCRSCHGPVKRFQQKFGEYNPSMKKERPYMKYRPKNSVAAGIDFGNLSRINLPELSGIEMSAISTQRVYMQLLKVAGALAGNGPQEVMRAQAITFPHGL